MDIQIPLRYPGAKKRLVAHILTFMEKNNLVGAQIVEPFCGSAIVSLNLLSRGLVCRAVLNDLDPLIYSFWRVVFEQPQKLVDFVLNVEITMKTWGQMKRVSELSFSERKLMQFAKAALFLNRTNYSGIISAGPIGGVGQSSDYRLDCRFNRQSISAQIIALAKLGNSVMVRHSDGIRLISKVHKRKSDEFLYLDPPYFRNGAKFYPHFFTHRDHLRLKAVLEELSKPWLLSYDFEEYVAELYSEKNQMLVALYHSARVARSKMELLISNCCLEFMPEAKIGERLPRSKSRITKELVLA